MIRDLEARKSCFHSFKIICCFSDGLLNPRIHMCEQVNLRRLSSSSTFGKLCKVGNCSLIIIRYHLHLLLVPPLSTSRGLPQVTVISPFAWNLVMDSLLHDINVAFADDLASLIAGHDLRSLILCMQNKVNTAIKWGSINGLELSKEKTEYSLQEGPNPKMETYFIS